MPTKYENLERDEVYISFGQSLHGDGGEISATAYYTTDVTKVHAEPDVGISGGYEAGVRIEYIGVGNTILDRATVIQMMSGINDDDGKRWFAEIETTLANSIADSFEEAA